MTQVNDAMLPSLASLRMLELGVTVDGDFWAGEVSCINAPKGFVFAGSGLHYSNIETEDDSNIYADILEELKGGVVKCDHCGTPEGEADTYADHQPVAKVDFAGNIYDRLDLNKEGGSGDVHTDLAEMNSLGEMEDYFGDLDPFEFL